MVKKLEKGATVTCYKCHGEGHKFYKCPQFVKKMKKGAKKKLNPHHQELPHIHQVQPQEQDQEQHLRHQEEGFGKMKEERGWNQPIWVPKEVITNMKGPQIVWVPKAT
jgi:hypothetical protein